MTEEEKNKLVTRDPETGLRLQTYRRFKEGEHYEPINQEQMGELIGFIQHCNKIHRGGRPPIYADVEEFLGVCDAFWDLMNETNSNGVKIIPDVEGFCCFAGIARDTLNAWETGRINKSSDFIDAIKRVKNLMAFSKKQLALSGKIPPIVFATDFNNNHGYTQKQEVVLTPNQPLGTDKTADQIMADLPDDVLKADFKDVSDT